MIIGSIGFAELPENIQQRKIKKATAMTDGFTYPGLGPVAFGKNRTSQLADDLFALTGSKDHPVVLISDSGLVQAGILAPIAADLSDHGYDVSIYGELTGEPLAVDVDAASDLIRRLFKKGETPIVIGIGGGSALDTAKLAAVAALSDDSIAAYALGACPFPQPQMKLVLVPTTAGTGSEMTQTAIFTNQKGRKVYAWGKELLPDLVLLDPVLTITVPASVTAASGIDALVHAIEACTCQNRNPICDGLALHAIRMIDQHLVEAVQNPSDLIARGGMLLASTLAGAAINVTGTGVAHALGHALATIAHVPHGLAVAVSMDATLKWNIDGNPKAYADLAHVLGMPPNGKAIASVFRKLLNATGLDKNLGDKQIDPKALADMMMAEENRPMVENNARSITTDDAVTLAKQTVRQFQKLSFF